MVLWVLVWWYIIDKEERVADTEIWVDESSIRRRARSKEPSGKWLFDEIISWRSIVVAAFPVGNHIANTPRYSDLFDEAKACLHKCLHYLL